MKLIDTKPENFNKNYALIAIRMLFKCNIKLFISYLILYILIVFNSKFIDCIFVYSDESGELKTIGGEDSESLKKQIEFKNKNDILACSWEND